MSCVRIHETTAQGVVAALVKGREAFVGGGGGKK